MMSAHQSTIRRQLELLTKAWSGAFLLRSEDGELTEEALRSADLELFQHWGAAIATRPPIETTEVVSLDLAQLLWAVGCSHPRVPERLQGARLLQLSLWDTHVLCLLVDKRLLNKQAQAIAELGLAKTQILSARGGSKERPPPGEGGEGGEDNAAIADLAGVAPPETLH